MDSLCATIESVSSLLELFRGRASIISNRTVYTFVGEGLDPVHLTYRELDLRAKAVASELQRVSQPGDRALLLFPAGLDFVTAFFGCVYAGLVAVPACYPKPRRPIPRLTAISRDASASIVLTTSKTLDTVQIVRDQPELKELNWVAVDTVPTELASDWEQPDTGRDDLLFLQYTSGSTTDPKGVMISNGNLLHNLEVIRHGFGIEHVDLSRDEPEVGVFWLPAYHDMGLIGGILTSMYVGGRSVLMSPTDFLRRPMTWLEAISKYRARISGAPNFAYELCVEKAVAEDLERIDLSCWKLGFCGAEPIRAETLERFVDTFSVCGFQADALYPCYGLAEATLMAAGGKGPSAPVSQRFLRSALAEHRVVHANGAPLSDVQQLVGCGDALLDQRIAVVDPATMIECGADQVGEIWVKGPSVAQGYWNRSYESADTFGARLADTGDGPFMRTGDLGFVNEGNLYVTGRIKDVIIIRGRNLYPQDIEYSVGRAHEALRQGGTAAFGLQIEGEERLGIVQEVDRRFRSSDLSAVVRQVRRAVIEGHEVDPHAIVLIRQASLPMTTSGKVQRFQCRQQYLSGNLRILEEWVNERLAGERSVTGLPADGNGAAYQRQRDGELRTHDNGQAMRLDTAHRSDPEPVVHRSSETNGSSLRRFDGGQAYAVGDVDRLVERVESWLLDWLASRSGVSVDEVHRDKPFAEHGLDSLMAVELSHEIEQWLGVQVTATIAWNYPTPAAMAGYLAREAAGVSEPVDDGAHQQQEQMGAHFEQMLAEIETMSESEAEQFLRQQGRAAGE